MRSACFALSKGDEKEFVKWAAGMHATPNRRHVQIYRRAAICQQFPAYKLEDLDTAPRDLVLALDLLALARKAQS